MIRRPPRSTQGRSSAASDVYKRQALILRRAVELSSAEERQHSLADIQRIAAEIGIAPVSYTHLRAHETVLDLVCRLLLEKKKKKTKLEQVIR